MKREGREGGREEIAIRELLQRACCLSSGERVLPASEFASPVARAKLSDCPLQPPLQHSGEKEKQEPGHPPINANLVQVCL